MDFWKKKGTYIIFEAESYAKGMLNNEYPNYAAAKRARLSFINAHKGNAVYMEHGGIDIMAGHATAGVEMGNS